MKLLEVQLIDSFSQIEKAMIRYILSAKSRGDRSMEMAQILQQTVIDFGEGIEEIRNNIKEVQGLELLCRNQQEKLNGIIRLLEDYCELIYEYAISSSDENAAVKGRLQKKGGEIALALRFELKQNAEEKYMPKSFENAQLFSLIDQANDESGSRYMLSRYTTYSYVRYKPGYPMDDVAVILQGPIDYRADFTMETLYLYRREYPGVMLIVSTWEGDVTEEFRWRAQAIGVDIVENKKPEKNGIFNLFMQIVSTRGDIKHARENRSIRYILKTRNDQRYHHPEFLNYLKNLLKQFPVGGSLADTRLIYTGYTGSMFSLPFRLTDFMLFGTAEMMERYWGAELDTCRDYSMEEATVCAYAKQLRAPYDNRRDCFSLDEKARRELGENIGGSSEDRLARSFYERYYLGRPLNETDDILLHYWNWLKDYVVIADEKSMLWIWDKYEYRYMDKNSNESEGDLNYFSWLDLYLNGIPGES